MPKAQVLVATTNPTTGEPLAAGATVDLDEEAYKLLRADGKVAASGAETKAGLRDHDPATGLLKPGPGTGQGNYSARTTRADAGQEAAEPKKK